MAVVQNLCFINKRCLRSRTFRVASCDASGQCCTMQKKNVVGHLPVQKYCSLTVEEGCLHHHFLQFSCNFLQLFGNFPEFVRNSGTP